MNKEKLIVAGEHVGEFLLGATIGIAARNVVKPEGKVETVLTDLGTLVVAWMAGRAFGKEYYGVCDKVFGTEFSENII